MQYREYAMLCYIQCRIPGLSPQLIAGKSVNKCWRYRHQQSISLREDYILQRKLQLKEGIFESIPTI